MFFQLGQVSAKGVVGHHHLELRSDGSHIFEKEEPLTEISQPLRESCPELYPSLLLLENRNVDLGLSNPFSGHAAARHAKLRPKQEAMTADGIVNGLIKFRMSSATRNTDNSPEPSPSRMITKSTMRVHHRPIPALHPSAHVPCEAGAFGLDSKLRLDTTDSNLLKFCECFQSR